MICVFWIVRVFITPTSGSPTAGENYSLECSAYGTMAIFEWLGPPNGRTSVVNTSSITISFNSTTSQLQFWPLQQSHNGSYSCRAITDEETLFSEPIQISVNGNLFHSICYWQCPNTLFNTSAPKIAIQITASGGDIAIAGEDYNLVCSVLGVEHLNPIISYQWRKNDNYLTEINSTILSLAPARISDAGANYSCSVTIVSISLTDSVVIMTSHRVRILSKFTYYLVNY